MEVSNSELVKKYNVPTPRYTSYPTVPHWKENITLETWKETIQNSFSQFNTDSGISIYIHLPYCEELCTYCGCNKRITKNHKVEVPYIEVLLQEWKLYLNLFDEKPKLKELHLGGGTPTFFSPENLKQLIGTILDSCQKDDALELSFEAHPGNTTVEHLKTLNKLGFKRISYGIQDFDLQVQKAINRFQSVELVAKTTQEARENGYNSINYDLVYGLPFQTLDGLKETIKAVIQLNPDRIAYYSYAHVPWTAKGQRLYAEENLPVPDVKLEMQELGKRLFIANGYEDIGMDHFALPSDEMSKSQKAGKLHRNFMGYTTNNTKLLIGLGVSSISDAFGAYGQNHKTIEAYKQAVTQGILPIAKGHLMTNEEEEIRAYINQLMCNFEVKMSENFYFSLPESVMSQLVEMEKEKLLELEFLHLKVPKKGKRFVRNICACLDKSLWEKREQQAVFSKGV